jgi:hypothetical protein
MTPALRKSEVGTRKSEEIGRRKSDVGMTQFLCPTSAFRIPTYFLLACIGAVGCASIACAGNCRQQVVVANQSAVFIPQGFIAVPFAVPVAVPSYVQYQAVSTQAQAAYGGPAVGYEEARANEPAATAKEELARSREARPAAAARVAAKIDAQHSPLTVQYCVKCHHPAGGAWARTKLDLSADLTAELRLKMIGRILADDPARRMPKGKALDAAEIGLLIQELSRPQ